MASRGSSLCLCHVVAALMTGLTLSWAAPAFAGSGVASPTAATEPTFDIWDYVVGGNTVLDEKSIDQALYPFLGPHRTRADVEKARAALEAAYGAHGYKTVSVVSAQMVKPGQVRFTVSEGRVGHLNVLGSKYSSIEEIKRQAPSLAEGQVPNFNQVPADLAALNQSADRRVTPELHAGSKPGTVDVDLDVVDHPPLHGNVEVNNRRSQDTSELRTSAQLSYDNLWQAGHSFSLSYQTAPERPSDTRVFYGSYLARFGASPFSLLLNGVKSNSNVATIGGTDVVGNGETATLQGTYNLDASDSYYSAVTFGISYKHFNNNVTATESQSGIPVQLITRVPITYYPMTVGYTTIWRRKTSVTQADLGITFAIPHLGSTPDEFDADRFGATGQQFYFRENLSYTQDLPAEFQSYVRFSGQLTDQPLVNTEQAVAGGLDTVRGYLEAETLGDYGFSGTGELRSPPLANYISFGGVKPVDELRFFAFFDGAEMRLRSPLPGQQDSFRLLSGGAGFNLRLFEYFNSSLVWADPFFSGPASKEWSSRLLFRVWTNF